VAPFFTPKWGDIRAKHWRIHPRAKPVPARRSALAFLHEGVAFCCRGKMNSCWLPTTTLYELIVFESQPQSSLFVNMKMKL